MRLSISSVWYAQISQVRLPVWTSHIPLNTLPGMENKERQRLLTCLLSLVS